ncbi:MAG: histidine kinase dimerization/phospho-acceptor domain-containing protein, partial [Jatrophihabitantaceae bacterium]
MSQQVELPVELAGFAAGLAHDLNNVLAVVGNYATLLSRRESDAMVRADLAEILAAVQRGRSITGQLQAIAGRELIDPAPVELNALLDSFLATRVDVLEHLLGNDIELVIEHSSQPLVALCDRRQLDQIVLNLVKNAAA